MTDFHHKCTRFSSNRAVESFCNAVFRTVLWFFYGGERWMVHDCLRGWDAMRCARWRSQDCKALMLFFLRSRVWRSWTLKVIELQLPVAASSPFFKLNVFQAQAPRFQAHRPQVQSLYIQCSSVQDINVRIRDVRWWTLISFVTTYCYHTNLFNSRLAYLRAVKSWFNHFHVTLLTWNTTIIDYIRSKQLNLFLS